MPENIRLYLVFTCLAWALLGAGCSPEAGSPSKRTLLQFGTLIEITLYDVETERAEAILDKLEADYAAYHASWTPWQDSPLRRANQALQAGKSIDINDRLLPLIEQSKILSDQSRGLFNPAIGGLIKLWQFHRHDEPDIRPPEKNRLLEQVSLNPTMNDLVLDGYHLSSKNPSVDLNFGAFAKGYAIDLSMAWLRSRGVENAIINAGGDLSVIGSHGDRPWKIGIRHPRKPGVLASIEARDGESIFTSGDYERFYVYENKRYHHILDPRTGYPSVGATSVTVIDDNAGRADAAATALFIAGPGQWHEIARSMNIRYVMLVDTDGSIHMNPAMAERVQLEQASDFNIVISDPL